MNDGSNWPWSEASFEKEGGGSGLLLSSQLHTKGDPYVPTDDELNVASNPAQEKSRFQQLPILGLLSPSQETLRPQTFSIQMRYQSETSIRPSEREMLVQKFVQARSMIAKRLLGQAAETSQN